MLQLSEPTRFRAMRLTDPEAAIIVVHGIGLNCRLYYWDQMTKKLVEAHDGPLEFFKEGDREKVEAFLVSFMSEVKQALERTARPQIRPIDNIHTQLSPNVRRGVAG